MNTRYDMPDSYYFGGGVGDSFVTPLSLVALLLAIFLILWLPRRYVLVPLLAAGILLPFGISVVVFGLHFPALRLILAAGWLRFVVRRDLKFPRLNSIDKVFLFWALSNAIIFTILWRDLGAATNRLGFLWTTLGSYFLARLLIRNKADMVLSIKVLAIVITVIASAMSFEHVTQHNVFSILGAPELSNVRDGSIRAKGPFAHSIIAGTIGAMLMPAFVGLWWQGKRNRLLVGLAVVASGVMAISSASSTPIMTYAAGVMGLLLWPIRQNLRFLRWGGLLGIVGLHLIMKAPVWFLIARAGGSLGGSGYHRAMLIDSFIRHFGQWWLVGTQNNANWGFDMWDVDNAYVAAGIGGGLITFVAFIAIFVYAYRSIGRSRRLAEKSGRDARFVWAIGCSLFANTVGFFGIVYFDQSILVWYCLLAMVSATATVLADGNKNRIPLKDDAAPAKETWESSAVPQYSARWV